MVSRDMISVGEICGTRGLQGEVKVLPLTDFPERFSGMKEIWIDCGPKSGLYKIQSCRRHKQLLLFKFAGVNTVEAASELVKGRLQVSEDQLFPLPEDTYYVFQLLGLEVEDEERGRLGQIKDILQTGANDVYVVVGEKYGEILIPAIKEVVRGIDLPNRKIKVKLLPGLIDEV